MYISGDHVPVSVPAYAGDGVLPEALKEAVRSITETFTRERRNGMEILSDGGTSVRVVCEDSPGTARAIFVHAYRTRDGIARFVVEHGISQREHEVLVMLIDGYKTIEIAKHLNVALSTVLLHIKSLLVKTHAHSRTELVGKVILHDAPYHLYENDDQTELD